MKRFIAFGLLMSSAVGGVRGSGTYSVSFNDMCGSECEQAAQDAAREVTALWDDDNVASFVKGVTHYLTGNASDKIDGDQKTRNAHTTFLDTFGKHIQSFIAESKTHSDALKTYLTTPRGKHGTQIKVDAIFGRFKAMLAHQLPPLHAVSGIIKYLEVFAFLKPNTTYDLVLAVAQCHHDALEKLELMHAKRPVQDCIQPFTSALEIVFSQADGNEPTLLREAYPHYAQTIIETLNSEFGTQLLTTSFIEKRKEYSPLMLQAYCRMLNALYTSAHSSSTQLQNQSVQLITLLENEQYQEAIRDLFHSEPCRFRAFFTEQALQKSNTPLVEFLQNNGLQCAGNNTTSHTQVQDPTSKNVYALGLGFGVVAIVAIVGGTWAVKKYLWAADEDDDNDDLFVDDGLLDHEDAIDTIGPSDEDPPEALVAA